MPTLTVENYLKALYALRRSRESPVSIGDLARSLELTPGSVTTMIQRLSRDTDFIEYVPRQGATLTRAGERVALKVLRRHRVLEAFLVEVVGLDWSEVHNEAENLEHAISDNLIERLAALLSDPDYDPHGAPIPSANGRMPADRRVSLAESNPGRFQIAALTDGSTAFREFAQDLQLMPGAEIELIGSNAAADTVSVRVRTRDAFGGVVHLGTSAASKIIVRASGSLAA